jgi:UPF0271 protein
MPAKQMDLNADLGETSGDHIHLLPFITSANLACGSHAGGGQILIEAVRAAAEHNVQIGAHPSYPDRDNFGRLSMRGNLSTSELVVLIKEQISVVETEVQKFGKTISHVKAHGALYNDAMVFEDIAEAVIEASEGKPILGLPNSVLERLASELGVPFIAEGFMDRAYTNSGTLVSRSIAGSVLSHDEALNQIRELAQTGFITSIDGIKLELDLQTICIHADTPDAAQTAASVRALFESEGIAISAFQGDQ